MRDDGPLLARRPADGGAGRWRPETWSPWTMALVLAAHAVFGLVMDVSPPPMATLHVGAVLLIGLWTACIGRSLLAVAQVSAYVAASDVLWRLGGASVPWETAKYALAVIFTIAIIRLVPAPRHLGVPIVYLLALVPSALVVVERLGPLGAREHLSFDLLAHLSLVTGVVFFSRTSTSSGALVGVLWHLVAPIVSLNTVAAVATSRLGYEDFSATSSNIASSGGYGPNQVSALIGIGAMACVFLAVLDRRPLMRVGATVLAVWFLAQSVLTFSRGGAGNLVLAFIATIPFWLRTARNLQRFVVVSVVVGVAIAFVFLPVIQSISGGTFEERFTSGNPTLRTDLIAIELESWSDHIGFGTGVGLTERRIEVAPGVEGDKLIPSHTEYTRLLAEHGLLGLLVILLIVLFALRAVQRQTTMFGRAFAAAFTVWAMSEMAHAATRIAMAAFAFVLASVRIEPDPVSDEPAGPTSWHRRHPPGPPLQAEQSPQEDRPRTTFPVLGPHAADRVSIEDA